MLLAVSFSCYGQGGSWIWMNGSNTANTQPVGLLGVTSVNNTPRGQYQAAQWTDKAGNFWIYGGLELPSENVFADLWKYDPVANAWTWVKGTGMPNQAGIYGVRGIPGPSNNPGCRWSSLCWTDTSGDFWLYGGEGLIPNSIGAQLGDLWRYHIASNEWTFMGGTISGAQAGNFGVLEQASPNNWPPSLGEVSTTWVDANNNLWLFGGGDNTGNLVNDIWRYCIATGEWTWMNGSRIPNDPGHRGIMGVESPVNQPCARYSYTHWSTSPDNIYIWGGCNIDQTEIYNDAWKYNMLTNNWSWVSGDSFPNSWGNYDQTCLECDNAVPMSRYENRSVQVAVNGNPLLCTFGGIAQNMDATNNYMNGHTNDLWLFDAASNKWKWVLGDDTVNGLGNFGTKGVAAFTNLPRARCGVCFWSDNNHNLWMYGGGDYNNWVTYNDIWEFIPDSTCLFSNDSRLQISASKTMLCPGDTAFICAPSGYIEYHWSTGETTACIKVTEPGDYSVNVIASKFCTLSSNHVAITVLPTYTVPITVHNDTLLSNGFASYQWFENGLAISGATSSACAASTAGNYTLQVTDSNGCVANSNQENINGVNILALDKNVQVFPNPAHESWQLSVDAELIGSTLEVFDAVGKSIFKSEIKNQKSLINIDATAQGVYELRIINSDYTLVRKLMKM